MEKIKTVFHGEDKKHAYVMGCEEKYRSTIYSAARRVVASGVGLVTLLGPSCSGKTTSSALLSKVLADNGKNVHIISIDDFYRGRDEIIRYAEENGSKPDFESAESLDLETLSSSLGSMLSGGDVLVPRFSFKSGMRVGEKKIKRSDNDIFILEGIQVMYPEITALYDKDKCFSVSINVASSAEIDGKTFLPEDIRLMRRIVRDYNFRSASPEFTLNNWESVRENEEKRIYPYIDKCDFKINSYMGYEVNMIKPYISSLLSGFEREERFYDFAKDTLDKLRHVPVIESKYLPYDSLFREFLG